MKLRLLIFLAIIICISFIFINCTSQNKDQFIFKMEKSTLKINKNDGEILFEGNGQQHFIESRPLQFLVNNDWISISSVGKIEYSDSTGAQISLELEDGSEAKMEITKLTENAVKLSISIEGSEATACRGFIGLNPVEEIYGFGEMWNGRVAQRGASFELWDKTGTPDECAYMPYYVSTKNYALFINYGGKVSFDVGKRRTDELVFEVPTGQLELMMVSGDNISSVVKNFLMVVGMPALPPRWTFEPWAWLMSDPDIPEGHISTLKGKHAIEMVNRFENLDIPIGVTWMEPPWQTARTSFVPSADYDPDLQKTISILAKKGVKTLAWTVPYTTNEASNWKAAAEKGYLVKKPGGNTDDGKVSITKTGETSGTNYNYIDFYNPEAYNWFKSQINIALDVGFKGFKLDAGQDLKEDALLFGNIIGADVHNSYANKYSQVFHDALTERYGKDFLMIPRAAWVGSSAYTNFKWPGDLTGSYANNGLPSSIYSSLSLAFSGFPFVSTDIGGFADRPAPEEIWVRWAQFGSMLPGMQTLHMPWWYSDKAIQHYRYLSWLHTDMIPMWNSLAKIAHETGAPVCRPLVWTYQDDVDCWRVDDEFTVGNALLVAPIYNSEYQRNVYLPEGRWINFWDEDEITEGKQTIMWSESEEDGLWSFPLYIREGAIIPMDVENEISGFGWNQKGEFITLAIWPEYLGSSEFVLNDLEGSVEIIVDWQEKDKLLISLSETKMNYIFRLHINDSKPPLSISSGSIDITEVSNKKLFRSRDNSEWHYDSEENNLWIRIKNDTGANSLKIILSE